MEKNHRSQNHYEKVFEQFRNWFLESDQEKTARKLGFSIDREVLFIPFFSEIYRADRKTGEIRRADGKEAEMTDKLTIMHHLHYYQEFAEESFEKIPFRQVREAAVFERAYERSAVEPLRKNFSGQAGTLLRAGLSLGGRQEKYGDVSVSLKAFPKIELTYIFWDKDEEFPASVQILFDNKITQWTHPESVPALAQLGTQRLIKAAKELEGGGGLR